MAKQVVNTDRIASSANRLRTVNGNINTAFATLRNKVNLLDSNWKGAAGAAAQTTKFQIFKDSGERSKVLQNYINLLAQQVDPGYNKAENVNKQLADKFK